MTSQRIRIEVSNGIGELILNKPERRNALSSDMWAAIPGRVKQLEADPGLYAAGISGAPVTKWELYDTHYTERYMGDPRKVPEAYDKASAIPDATDIADPLLLVHGLADDNVVFENSSALIATLQEGNVPFEMMLYPGYTHRVSGENISPHLWNTIFRFLESHGVTPPE